MNLYKIMDRIEEENRGINEKKITQKVITRKKKRK